MSDENLPKVVIASIHFAYDNKELIELLEKRGNSLVTEDFDRVDKLED